MCLKKVTAIKTLLFLDFCEKQVQKEIQTDIERCKNDIRNSITDPKVKEKVIETRIFIRKSDPENKRRSYVFKDKNRQQKDKSKLFEFQRIDNPTCKDFRRHKTV